MAIYTAQAVYTSGGIREKLAEGQINLRNIGDNQQNFFPSIFSLVFSPKKQNVFIKAQQSCVINNL